jgi:tripartite-type tricarboxylate transporter receptor subunit TctC
MSSSFIIRPYFEKTQPTHNLDNFTPILVQGTRAPLYFFSKKLTSIGDVLKTPNVSIAVSGIGSISHLAANEILKVNKTTTIVNFQNMMDGGTAAAGGHVDVAIAYQIDVQGLIDSGSIRMIGATGSPRIDRNLLLTTHKLKDAGVLTANYAIFASKKMSPDRFQEIHNMLIKVNGRPAVVDSYRKDQLTIVNLNPTQSSDWYTKERAYWKKQISLINE